MRGRKPKPTAQKKLDGNPGKRALNANEPQPERKAPPCPDHLGEAAKAEWARLAPALEGVGLMSAIDGDALALYCAAYERWVEAEKQLRQTGVIVKSPSGYPIQNPYLAISKAAAAQMQKLLVEFGMTPSSRSRITTEAPAEDELGDFLRFAG